jgi:protein TonB
MSRLRSLLRLEEKVAAEGRRIENLGGPPMRWVAPAVLIAALGLHGAVLLLPAAHSHPPPAAASPMPDYPRVWRAAPPAIPPPAEPETQRSPAVRETRRPAPEPLATPKAMRALSTEPVPEPAPELALNAISADVEAIIPNPDPIPTSPDFGPSSRTVVVAPPQKNPALLESVPPVYPVAARALRAEARVTLRLAVLPDGSVGRASVEQCTRSGLGFEAAALEAVKRWRYEPAPPASGARRVMVEIHFQQEEARP